MGFRMEAMAVATAVVVGLGSLPGTALGAASWKRLWGQDAYDTMRAIVDEGDVFSPERVRSVIIATGEGYHDALSASGIAGLEDAPVLITPTASLGGQAREEIQRLQPETAYVVGGPMSVSEGVLDEVRSLGVGVVRLSGEAAPDTAVEVYNSRRGDWGQTAVVAASTGYWDALAAAPYAYAADAPMFLTGPDGLLGQKTVDAILGGGFTRVLVSGGPLSVSEGVVGQLPGVEVVRRSGQSALETSAEVATWARGEALDGNALAVASSSSYHDALTGAPLAGMLRAPLVLVDPTGGLQAYDAVGGAGFTRGYVFGGPMSVSDENYTRLSDTLVADPALDEMDVYRQVLDSGIHEGAHYRGRRTSSRCPTSTATGCGS